MCCQETCNARCLFQPLRHLHPPPHPPLACKISPLMSLSRRVWFSFRGHRWLQESRARVHPLSNHLAGEAVLSYGGGRGEVAMSWRVIISWDGQTIIIIITSPQTDRLANAFGAPHCHGTGFTNPFIELTNLSVLSVERYVACDDCLTWYLQGSAKRWASGLVNFVAAVAYHICLALSAAFKQPGAYLLAKPCTDNDIPMKPHIMLLKTYLHKDFVVLFLLTGQVGNPCLFLLHLPNTFAPHCFASSGVPRRYWVGFFW